MAIVSGTNLAQRYGRRWVFNSLDITIEAGVTVILGPNGSGKTTLFHTLLGLKKTKAGQLSVLCQDMLAANAIRQIAGRVGFLPQTVGFYPGYTVGDFVSYAAWLKGIPQAETPRRVADALLRVDLVSARGLKMNQLSGGMLRRAGIAQAIVHEPELLVLDEPAAGLDPEQRIELRNILRSGLSKCIVLSTHVVEDVRHLAGRILILNQGRIVFTGSVDELAALGSPGIGGDSDLERGYMSVIDRSMGEEA